MSTIKVEKISEPKVRYMGDNVVLFINSDGSWSIGPNTNKLVKVNLKDVLLSSWGGSLFEYLTSLIFFKVHKESKIIADFA